VRQERQGGGRDDDADETDTGCGNATRASMTLAARAPPRLLASSSSQLQMVRMRGLLPLPTPTSCGQQLLDDLHGDEQLLVASNLLPFSFPSSSFSCLSVRECRERERELEREGENEWDSWLVLWFWVSTRWTGVGVCGVGWNKQMTPMVYCMGWTTGSSARTRT
jgi:hypothetical protein